MNYSDKDVVRQLQLGEDSRWEFKRITFSGTRPDSPSRDDLADEIAAFANARGGVLLCSVTDEGDVQNMSREQLVALDSFLVELSTDSIKPPVRVHVEHKQISGAKRILLVEIPQGDSQHDSPGGSYIRVGGTKRRMSSDERLRLSQRRSQARFFWFDKQPVLETGFNTLSESLWKPLLSAEGRANPEQALQKMALLVVDETGTIRSTVSGVLLCTPTPKTWLPNAYIAATRYNGLDRASPQQDSQTIAGPLPAQVSDAVAFVMRNRRVAASKKPGRVELPEYSEKAVFEALVNAVAHRDYSISGSAVRLSMFNDRLEIQSPGSLPNNLTIESMELRQATRNEALTSVLTRMPIGGIPGSDDRQYFMERRGDGVSIIRRETVALCGKPPRYDMVDDAELCLTIPAAVLTPSPGLARIMVYSAGKPAAHVDILVLFPNKTWKRAATNSFGEAALELHSCQLPMTVFAAAHGFSAMVQHEWIPSEHTLCLELPKLPEGGSAIFPENTGHLPGLRGRLNPIRDTHDRTYLYASNIAINDGRQQPVAFSFGEEMRLTDAEGNKQLLRIIDIAGRAALLEYRPYRKLPAKS